MSKVIDINGSLKTVVYTTGSPADITVNSVSVGSAPSGGSLDIAVNLDGSPAGSWDGDSWEITSDPCPDTTIEVNGTIEGTVVAGSTVDIQLSDSGGVVTPTSVTQVGNDFQVVLPDAPAPTPRSTATLMKTGSTTSYAAEDDFATSSQGRAGNFTTLDSAPLHNNGSATINTTTNRFTDTLGGQTYTDTVVLDWSTWNGSTLLGYRRTLSGTNQTWEDARVACVALTIGGFSDWRVTNVDELNNICKTGQFTNSVLEYAPFSSTADLNIWTSTTYPKVTANAYFLGSTGSGTTGAVLKTIALGRYIPIRTYTLSTLNVLS